MATVLENVLAVVVTYHPDAGLDRRLEALRGQVGSVLVVDNGSPNIGDIEAMARAAGCRLIANAANLGVAAALNAAARVALAEGFEWLASFDQDSLAPPGALAGLIELYAAHPWRKSIAVLAMSHRDRATGRDYHRSGDILEETGAWRSVRTTITSGALTRCEAFRALGLFDERLFIDGVDHDFCLRCRGAGWRVIESRGQVMDHSLGAISRRRLLWGSVACSNHSALRRYYITRNTLELSLRHLRHDPVWCLRAAGNLLVDSLVVVLLEEDRQAKLGAILQGTWHFVLRRFGPRLPEPRAMGSCAPA